MRMTTPILILLLMTTFVFGNRCHRNVDNFMKRIFKGVKLSLDQDDIIALTNMKDGSCAFAKRIYFSAYLTSYLSSSNLKSKQPILYNEVVTNEGGAYNSSSGEFTAPKDGGYTFFWEFLVLPKGKIRLELQINDKLFGHSLAHAQGSDSHYELASKSTIVNLNKGDKVRVVYYGGNGKLLGGYRYTGFSGFSM